MYTSNQIAEHILKKAGFFCLAELAKTAPLAKLDAFVEIARMYAKDDKDLLLFIDYWW